MSEAPPPAPAAPPPGMPTSMVELLSWHNPVFRQYAFWTGILVIKMAIMSIITIVQRIRTKSLPADVPNDKVDRAVGAHRNDLENIVPYILVSFTYAMTAPYPIVAVNLFRIGAAFRIFHTIVYAVFPLRQPARFIGFVVPLLIMIYMAVWSSLFFFMCCAPLPM